MMGENELTWAACIVYYEDPKSLKNLLENLQSQTLKPTEIFIVDNSSNLAPILQDAKIKIDYTKLDKNLGFGAAANIGINKAIEKDYSNFILFSQDVELENNSCEKLITNLNLNKGITFPTMINRKNNKIFSKGGVINKLTGSIKLYTEKVPRKIYWADGSCLAFDKDTFNSLNGFYENYFMYFEDVDFCFRASIHNLKLSHVETKASQNPNGPSLYFRSKNSIIFSRRINSKMMSIAVTKRNLLGAFLLFAKFRFADAKQRFLGIIAGWKAQVD